MTDQESAPGTVTLLKRAMALIEAVQMWASDCEGWPDDPSDARLLKALWTYDGDKTEPCPECDGECGEPCAPCTVAEAHAYLDRFTADWLKKNGVTVAHAQAAEDAALPEAAKQRSTPDYHRPSPLFKGERQR